MELKTRISDHMSPNGQLKDLEHRINYVKGTTLYDKGKTLRDLKKKQIAMKKATRKQRTSEI